MVALSFLLQRYVPRAAIEAPLMPTEDRVERFGKLNIQEIFESMLLEDFQQEFEDLFIDESYSFYPYDLILPCCHDIELCNDFLDIPSPRDGSSLVMMWVGP